MYKLLIWYSLFNVLERFLIILPESGRMLFFKLLAKTAYKYDKKHNRVIKQNLKAVFKDTLDDIKCDEIKKSCYLNLATNIMQLLHNKYYSEEKICSRFIYENSELNEHAFKQKRPIVYVTAHFGNWELAPYGLKHAAFGKKVNIVYKKMKNPYFEKHLLSIRNKNGIMMIESEGAVRKVAKAMQNDEVVSFLIDQNMGNQNALPVDLFGLTAMQTSAPAALARKYNALIVVGFVYRRKDGMNVMRTEGIIEVEHTADKETDIQKATQLQAAYVEQAIRKAPELWFWCHRRFKYEHPEIYTT